MKYAAKLLLFGEYTVITGSQALAMTLPAYFGRWAFSSKKEQQQQLPLLAEHLESLKENGQLLFPCNIAHFKRELSKGLYFASNIPPGYGLGSSGALCAAIYNRYGMAKVEREEQKKFSELKDIFAQMESFFHGSSSGIDPLICYLNQAILIGSDGAIQTQELPEKRQGTASFFLLDTGISRKTAPLVNVFLEKCQNRNYKQKIISQLLPEMNSAIADFLSGDWDHLSKAMEIISSFQLQYFSEMIPAQLRDLWQEGLETKSFLLKLCGAGGGGVLLGYTKDFESVPHLIQDFTLRQILAAD